MSTTDWELEITGSTKDFDGPGVALAVGTFMESGRSYAVQALPSGRWAMVDPGNLESLMTVVGGLSDEAGLYFGINPLRADFVKPAKKGWNNPDVAYRRWFLADIDSTHPKKTNATEEEKAAALDVVNRIIEYLTSLGWPAPIVVDSGNGYHLYWRIDLPNDPPSQKMLAGVLKALAKRFDTDGAKVDKTVHDAKRIARFPGTWSRKGEHSEERPQRLAKFIYIPDVVVVPLELLRAESGIKETPETTGPALNGNGHAGDWILPIANGDEAWGRARLELNLAELASTTQNRNDCLRHASTKIASAVAGGHIDEKEARNRLASTAWAIGLGQDGDPDEIDRAITNGFNIGLQNPIHPESNGTAKDTRANALPLGAAIPPTSYAELSNADLGIHDLAGFEERAVDWLWPYRLAQGEMAAFAGEGGMGKSQLLLAIAAWLSNGDDWPDGSGPAPVGRTVILAAEDSPETTIKPRLIAMGANIGNITILTAKVTVNTPGKPRAVAFQSLQNLDYWRAVFDRLPDTLLFIVDPLPSYLGKGVNDSKNIEVRNAIEPFLDEIIRPRSICMAANSHLNKGNGSNSPIHRMNGSVAYGNLARNVHFVVKDPRDPGHRIFTQAKCNNAPDDLPSIGFRIEKRLIQAAGGEIETAIPVFDAETMQDVDLGEALAGDKGSGKRGPTPEKLTRLAKFLVELLRDKGPVFLGKIISDAGEAGHIGTQGSDGMWSMRTNLYQAMKHVPDLPAPHDGWTVVTSKDEPGLKSSNGKARWTVRRSEGGDSTASYN